MPPCACRQILRSLRMAGIQGSLKRLVVTRFRGRQAETCGWRSPGSLGPDRQLPGGAIGGGPGGTGWELGVHANGGRHGAGSHSLRHRGPAVEALPVDEKSPVVLRIAEQTESAGSTIYELRYLGMKPGRYDLRSYLRHVDGRPRRTFGPIMVSVVSVLPANYNGQLDELAHPPLHAGLALPPAADPRGRLVARAAGLAAWRGRQSGGNPARAATARPSRR